MSISFTPPPGTGVAPPAAPVKGARRTGLAALGGLLLVGGVGGGLAMMLLGSSQYEDAVANLARAPIGCTTALDFTETGAFTVYIETKGSVETAGGDCPNDGSYEYTDDDLPRVSLTLTDRDGDEVDFDRDAEGDYDAGGFAGQAFRTFTIDEPGSYRLRVESDEDDFAIAVGRQPKEDTSAMAGIGLIVAAIGLLLGGLLLILGLRRRKVTPPPGGGQQVWQTPGGVPGAAPAVGSPAPPGQPAAWSPAGAPGFGAPPNVAPPHVAQPNVPPPPASPGWQSPPSQ